MQTCCPSPKGVVLAPPLIGGHAVMQFRMLRPLARRHFDLISFNYAGHDDSNGRFTFQAALDNTLTILDQALNKCRATGLPLYGFASCFAAIPLLNAIGERHQPMSGMVLINAVPQLRSEKLAADFLRFWHGIGFRRPIRHGMGVALQAYLDDLFPHIAHKGRGFGILARNRIQWPRVIQELYTLRNINAEPLHATPVLCVYGRHDQLLRQMGFADWSRYERLIAGICPQAEFRPLDGGHFLTGPAIRRQLMDAVAQFFSRYACSNSLSLLHPGSGLNEIGI